MVHKGSIPKDADIINSMWAMKKKTNGDYRVCLVAQGYKETQGKSCVHHDISSPVVHDITVQIVLVLMLMSSLAAHVVDVNGVFLLGAVQANRKNLHEGPIRIQKDLSSGWIVVFKLHLVWSEECSQSLLEIIARYR